jgi:hypothetical protein
MRRHLEDALRAGGSAFQAHQADIPREFARVATNLDYCDGQDFEKARISIDWMSTCLKNFTKNYNLGFCSGSKSYFCPLDPQSDACLQGH